MGTQVHCKSYFPGYYSMRDLNEDSSSSSWPLFYGDKTLTNGQYCNGFIPRAMIDGHSGYDKDAVKQKMLEHEAIFKNQVHELHRLYRIQRDMMEEIKRKELSKHRESMEPSSSSSLHGAQMPSEDPRKWHMSGLPLLNSAHGRPSISGSEFVNSPSSCVKGNNMQSGQIAFQNGFKDPESMDSRPSKVRKKLFDLQLPADEYIDTEEGEQLQDSNVTGILSHTANGGKFPPESCIKLASGGTDGKTDSRRDASASSSCLRNSIGLADLNEPIQVEDASPPSSVGFLGYIANGREIKGIEFPGKPNGGISYGGRETINSTHNGFMVNSAGESKVSERGLFSYINEAGHSRSNLSSVGVQRDKLPIPSHQPQVLLNQAHHPLGIYTSDHKREDPWRGVAGRFESCNRSLDHSNYSHMERTDASQVSGLYPFVNSSGFPNSWSHSVASWAKTTSSFTQNIATFHTDPSFDSSTASRNKLQPSAHSMDTFADKWNVNGSSRFSLGSGSDPTKHNGFHQGCASGTKELPVQASSAGFDYLNSSRADNVMSETNHAFEKFLRGPSKTDSKLAIDVNLNAAFVNSSSDEVVSQQDPCKVEKSKPEDYLPTLPWLKPKLTNKSEIADCKRESTSGDLWHQQGSVFPCKSEAVRDLNQVFTANATSASWDHEVRPKKENGETQNVSKILGVPIFGIPSASKNESPSLVSTSANLGHSPEQKNVNAEGRSCIIDINVACDPSDEHINGEGIVTEKETRSEVTGIRNQIDLNSCISEDEYPSVPSAVSNSGSVRVVVEIDLEAPVLPESEDDMAPAKDSIQVEASLPSSQQVELKEEEIMRDAAEAIVAISASQQQIQVEDKTPDPSEASFGGSLLWFVDVISSFADELDSNSGKEMRGGDIASTHDFSDEMDDFEVMTLQLKETKEEDYMPKPFVPEIQKVEETGANSLPNRTRRGQARRGRQRRDFQRDILPGLASLSRHEVTEDLQTFGGLMRATGHAWNSGLTRRNGVRNGGGRGRRRAVVETATANISTQVCTPLVQQLNNIECGLEDRSLTGWGKTPRRPRRQRCPAGNPSPVPLT